MIDTHAHLNTKVFNDKIDEILDNAKSHGVDKIIVVGMDQYHNDRAITLANTYPNLFASVGIHPTTLKGEVADLKPLFKDKKVIAVGETGIDLHWDKTNLSLQTKYFEAQIKLAIELDLPLIVHTRNSFMEAYDILKPYQGKVRGVFHSFSSDLADAKKAVAFGFYIGISGVVTFPKATILHDVVKHIDLKHIILETDAPYLAPVPYRGKTNQPAYTSYVLEMVAKIKEFSPSVVDQITTENAHKLFKLEAV